MTPTRSRRRPACSADTVRGCSAPALSVRGAGGDLAGCSSRPSPKAFWRTSMSRSLSGVGGVLSCAHRDKETGQIHGHTWDVVAWFRTAADARYRQKQLSEVLHDLDHGMLPDDLAWGEDLARHIAEKLGDTCAQVDVNRPSERIYARWVVRDTPFRKHKQWTVAEAARASVLRELGFTYKEIGKDLNRTAKSVKRKLQAIGCA